MLFLELPLLRRPAAARAAGFDTIEMWWPFNRSVPPDREVTAFIGAVLDGDVSLRYVNLAGGDMACGQRGLMSWPGRETEFADSLAVAIEIGRSLGVRGFNALYGNRLPGIASTEQDAVALQNLALAAQHAATIGADILLEPLSGVPTYPLRTAADVAAVIATLAQVEPRFPVRMLADLYHLTTNGDDVARVLREYGELVGHVQLADAPGRHEPGTGVIDFTGLIAILLGEQYNGWLSLEYVPTQRTQVSLAGLPDPLRPRPYTRKEPKRCTSIGTFPSP